MTERSDILYPDGSQRTNVVTLEGDKPLTVPHIMPIRDWHGLREDLGRDEHTAVAMRLGYAAWRHLFAIVVDARLMLEFNQFVVVQLRVAQFDDGN